MTGFFQSRLMQPVSPVQGESGYFSAPSETLDPRLFDGDHFKTDVRTWILNTLYEFWGQRYRSPKAWSTVWIAGSGISYQWEAGRGNGDLDVLIGVDFPRFWTSNQQYLGLSENDVAEIFNQEFHQNLWPSTANASINGGTFEVTFYVNPNSTDIRDINPYAAYDLTHDSWTVRPPHGDAFNHPKEFYDYAQREVGGAEEIVAKFNTAANKAKAMNPGSPGWHNAMREVDLLASQASTMYDSIHLGRRAAFSSGGSGYGDYYNFRWQYHKQHGTAQALNAVAHAHKEAHDEFNSQIYGAAIEPADVALRRAALWNRGAR